MRDVVRRFQARAAEDPDRPLFTWVDDAGEDERTLTHAQLNHAATALAGRLLGEYALRPGERVLLAHPPSLEFVIAFTACLMARVIPAPVPPLRPFRLRQDLAALDAIAASAGARAVLTTAANAGITRPALDAQGGPALPWYATEAAEAHETHDTEPVASATLRSESDTPRPDDLAFLQYTSGSTSTPKGVAVTYGNLSHQLEMHAAAFQLGPETRAVFWMPHYHDFCLIGGVLGALHGNGRVYLLAPDSFIRRPAVWPQVLSRVRATHTGASNFGYDLVVRRTTPEQRAAWDLSALRVAVSAAEPVRRRTAQSFVEAFASSGLRPEAFCVAYGLAEHTAAVSLGGRGWRRVGEQEIASCGAPGAGVDVRVVDPETLTPVADGAVGELWVSSPSACAGYYGLAEETRATFAAQLEGDAGRRFLRTGDLGFMEGGEVYVCGRVKDLIIVRGRNVYPQDVEAAVEASHPALLPGASVAFAVPQEETADGEGLVVVAEVRARRLATAEGEEIARAVEDAVRRQADAPCAAVALVQPGGVPRTTSGKVRRRATRDSYLDGTLLTAPRTLHVRRAATGHPLVRDLDPEFRRVAGRAIGAVYKRAAGTHRRAAHGTGVVAAGTLRMLEAPGIPPHRLFGPGAEYSVVLRHSSNKGFEDDAIADVRGAALRLLPPGTDTTSAAPALAAGLLDLALATGTAFFLPTAAAFVEFALGTPESRLETLRRNPGSAASIQDIIRDPDSFSALDYESQVTYAFVGLDGVRRLVRYRLTALESPPLPGRSEHGRVAPERVRLPLEYAPRLAGDTRPTTYLRDDFARRVTDGGVRYCLQLQLRDADPLDPDADGALDCTRAWPPERYPWHDVAAITLDRVLDAETAEALSFDPTAAPADLAFIPARSASDHASINHLRGLAYEASTHARLGRPLPEALASLVREAEPERGASGNAYGVPRALPDALADAALALHFTKQKLDAAADPIQQIVDTWKGGPLAEHPAALAAVVGRLRATRLTTATPAPPEALGVGPRFAGTFETVSAGDADAVLAASRAYDLPCLELLRWRERFSCALYQTREALIAYLVGTPDVVPAESHLPVAVALDADTVLAVARYVSVLPERELVIVSEYATALVRRGADWKIQAVLETDYEERRVVGGEEAMRAAGAAYLSAPLSETERMTRLTLAAAGRALVETFVATGSTEATPAKVAQAEAAPPPASKRVVVVGGGAAGLSAAWELERLGHHVTVLERDDAIAGKCASVEVDGVWHDLGAHLLSNQCRRVYALAQEVGCPTEPLVAMRLYDPETRSVDTRSAGALDREALMEFRTARRAHFPTIGEPGLAHAAGAMAEPVAPWLVQHRLSALAALETSFTAAGYGQLRDPSLAALYLAKYGELLGLFAEDLTGAAPERFTIKGGFMELWRRVARRLRDVRCGVRIEAIERDAAGVRVHTEDGVLEFDALVLAVPLETTVDFLDLGAEERKLFSRIRHNDYYTIVASLSGLPRDGFYLVKHLRDGAHLRVEPGRITAFQHRYPGSDVYVCWAYADSVVDPPELQRRLREDVERWGGSVEAIHTYRRWKLFPHFGAEDVAAGAHQRLEALQGQRRTYYTGSLLGFELVEPTVAHAQETMRAHFAGAAPAIAPAPVTAPVPALAAAPVAPVAMTPVAAAPVAPPAAGGFDAAGIERWLVNRVAAARGVAAAEIDASAPLELHALESLQVVALLADLSDYLDWRVTPSLLLEYPTLAGVAGHLAETVSATASPAPPASVAATASPAAILPSAVTAQTTSPLLQRLGRLFRAN